nr:hypothetical protein [Saprospiraceae bacterium]
MKENGEPAKRDAKSQRQRMWRFCLKTGLSFAIVGFIVVNAVDLKDHSLIEIYFSLRGLITLAIWLIIGIFMIGPVLWYVNKKSIKKIRDIQEYNEE